jgi:hypothetical protein
MPHTRRQAARRLGTSPRQIRLVERNALQRLNGLAQTNGCGGTTELVGGVTVVDGFIGPAEVVISPALAAFGNPGFQGIKQSSFGTLGDVPPYDGPAPLPARFGPGSSGSTWASQLLAIMFVVALLGFRRMFPLIVARLRRRPLPVADTNVEYLERVEPEELEGEPLIERPAERRREKIAA